MAPKGIPVGATLQGQSMKRTKILAVLLLLLATVAYASDMKAEICPICLFPHENGIHQPAVPEAPTMLPPVAIPYALPLETGTADDEDIALTFSIGAASGMSTWSWWLDCMAPTGLEKDSWIIDVMAGFSFMKTDLFSFGFEAGAILHLDEEDSVDAYDIPLMLKMALEPGAGIFGFPMKLGIGAFTGFSPVTRKVSFGTAANASVGVLVRLGEHFRVGVDTKIEALMRLDVQNGHDSTFELMWIPAVVTLGIRF